jgi:hypothetical protein
LVKSPLDQYWRWFSGTIMKLFMIVKKMVKKAARHVAAFLLLNGAIKTTNNDSSAKNVVSFISGEMIT